MDRSDTRTDPLLRGEQYDYDGNGNLQQVTDRKGQVTTYTYDALDRLSQITYHDLSTTTYSYDAGDRLLQMVDSIGGTITRTYDGLDRLTSESTPEGMVSYTYDAADRRATMTVAGQPAVTYGYDPGDRLASITQGSSVVAFGYDSAGRRTTLTLPNGIVVTSSYDAASQVTELAYTHGATTLGTLTYAYDADGNRTTVGGSWARTGLPPALASAAYDDANQIATWAETTFTYDGNGNLTFDGQRTYTWNARDELTALSGSVSASFQYDGAGRRRTKTISGATTGFLYDGLNAVQELTGGSASANILPGLDLDVWFTRTDGVGTRHFLSDVLGSTVGLADDASAVQTAYTYEPFGVTTTSGAASANALQFTGRERDDTGLFYYRARYYRADLARFTSEDPIDFADRRGSPNLSAIWRCASALSAVHLHAYVADNPIRYVDRLGLEKEDESERESCIAFFMNCLRNWIVPGLPATALEMGGQGLAEARAMQLHNQALRHALSRGLRYPQKSSIFRNLMANSRWWRGVGMGAAAVGTLTLGVYYCLYLEIEAGLNGTCRP